MRRKRLAPCSAKGCPTLTIESHCPRHAPEPWSGKRGFTDYKGDWLKTRKQVLKEEPICRIQGPNCTGWSQTVDHITPRSEGGTDDRLNLRGACYQCHRRKSQEEAARARERSAKFQQDCGFE